MRSSAGTLGCLALAWATLAMPAETAPASPEATRARSEATAARPEPARLSPDAVLAVAATPGSTRTTDTRGAAAARQRSFLELLRTYAERRPEESLALVERLVDAGPFAEHDRAEYWLGSARLSLGDLASARTWFSRLMRDHPDSPWAERSLLGLAEAEVRERRYGAALSLHVRAEGARDPGVRELARLSRGQVLILRARQRWAWVAAAFASAVGLFLFVSIARLRPRLWPAPAELRIVGPVLAVLALLALRQDPAPRAAVLEVASAGAVLATMSGLRLRGLPGLPGLLERTVHAALALTALCACAYAAAYRNDLVGMMLETVRAGPE
jgi:tetratricopeptide (TPR) repeat protein